MTHSGSLHRVAGIRSAPRTYVHTADKRVLCAAVYSAPHRSRPPCARPKGLKLEQWISGYVRCLLPRVDGPARIRAHNAAFSGTAKFHAALRSSSRFPFLFFSFRTHPISVIGPRRAPVLLLFVRSFVRFESRSPELSRFAAPTFSHVAFTLIPFSRVFPLDRLLRTSVRFNVPFHLHLGVPVFGARHYCTVADPLFPL